LESGLVEANQGETNFAKAFTAGLPRVGWVVTPWRIGGGFAPNF
jgi:hypothetical protein